MGNPEISADFGGTLRPVVRRRPPGKYIQPPTVENESASRSRPRHAALAPGWPSESGLRFGAGRYRNTRCLRFNGPPPPASGTTLLGPGLRTYALQSLGPQADPFFNVLGQVQHAPQSSLEPNNYDCAAAWASLNTQTQTQCSC